MAKIRIDAVDQLTVQDVLHAKLSTLDASATIADVREYFAQSASRRQAFVVDDGRYVGSLTPADIGDGVAAERLAADVAAARCDDRARRAGRHRPRPRAADRRAARARRRRATAGSSASSP